MSRTSVAALLAVCALASAAAAQPQQTRPAQAKNYICPLQIAVRMLPANTGQLAVTGWQVNDAPFLVQLDPANPPHFSGGQMTCYYKLGNQPGAFMLFQPIGSQKCSVISNGTGFVCTL